MNRDDTQREQFWREKEREHGSSLVIATAADYLQGYPGLTGPVSGLLYFMGNGIHFENFPNTHWFGNLLRQNEQFVKIKLDFPAEIVGSVAGRSRPQVSPPLPLWERLVLFFSPAARHLIITCKHDAGEQRIVFDCLTKPRLLCEAYERERAAQA